MLESLQFQLSVEQRPNIFESLVSVFHHIHWNRLWNRNRTMDAICYVSNVKWVNMRESLATRVEYPRQWHATRTNNKIELHFEHLNELNLITITESRTCMSPQWQGASGPVNSPHKQIRIISNSNPIRIATARTAAHALIGIPLTVDFHLNGIGIQSGTCFVAWTCYAVRRIATGLCDTVRIIAAR